MADYTQRSLHILIVDDCHDTTESLAMLIRLWGHVPSIAYDGPTAIEQAVANPPDVVLLDIGLPGMSGWEVASRLRLHAETEQLLLVAMTGYGTSGDQRHSRDAGFDLHLLKPVRPDVLQGLLDEWVVTVARPGVPRQPKEDGNRSSAEAATANLADIPLR